MDCDEMRMAKLEELTHMEYNRQNYNELTQMVGLQITGALFTNPLHLDGDLVDPRKEEGSNCDSYVKFAEGSQGDGEDIEGSKALKRELAQNEVPGLQRQRTLGESQNTNSLKKFDSDLLS